MGKWNELRKIRDIDTLRLFLQDNKDFLKKLSFPVVVAAAILVFWIWGGQGEETVIDKTGNETLPATEELTEAQKTEDDSISSEAENSEPAVIFIDIGGEVKNPGVYQVEEGTRLFQVIEKAGGLTEFADVDDINQAEQVTDGQKILVGSTNPNSPYYGKSESAGGSSTSAVRQGEEGVLVNINQGDSTELQLIPGVGPATADKIIEYRETNGPFAQKEDIKNVSGIGEKTYEALKDYICV